MKHFTHWVQILYTLTKRHYLGWIGLLVTPFHSTLSANLEDLTLLNSPGLQCADWLSILLSESHQNRLNCRMFGYYNCSSQFTAFCSTEYPSLPFCEAVVERNVIVDCPTECNTHGKVVAQGVKALPIHVLNNAQCRRSQQSRAGVARRRAALASGTRFEHDQRNGQSHAVKEWPCLDRNKTLPLTIPVGRLTNNSLFTEVHSHTL